MVRPIILYGDPVLEIKSTEVKKSNLLDVTHLISDLFETMHRANGVGLAGVQIGVPVRVFVIDANLEKEDFHFKNSFINPKILREWGEAEKHPEGCLSIPQIAALVSRLPNIELEWYDESWTYHKEIFDGFAARIIQHEYEHLDGEIYVDRLDLMWQEMLKTPLDLIRKRKVEVPYLYK